MVVPPYHQPIEKNWWVFSLDFQGFFKAFPSQLGKFQRIFRGMFQLLYADLRGSGVPSSQRFCVGKKVGRLVDGVTWVAPIAEKNWATGVFSALEAELWPLHTTGFLVPPSPKVFFSSFCLATEKSGSRNDPPSSHYIGGA